MGGWWRTRVLLVVGWMVACGAPTASTSGGDDPEGLDDIGGGRGRDDGNDGRGSGGGGGSGSGGGSSTDTDGSGDTDTAVDTDTDTGGPVAANCPALKSASPSQGARDVFARPTFSLSFSSKADDVVSFGLRRVGGSTVALGSATWDASGRNVYFGLASGSLTPSADYRLTALATGCSDVTVDFRTSSVGAPVTNLSALVGATFVVDVSSLNVVEPAGLGATLSSLLSGLGDDTYATTVLTSTSSHTRQTSRFGLVTASVSSSGAVSGFEQQCEATAEWPSPFVIANPYFSLDASSGLTLSVAGMAIKFRDVRIEGAFRADGSALTGMSMDLTVDARDLADVLGDLLGSNDPAAACNLLTTFGVTCGTCSDGKPYCIDLVIADVEAPRAYGETVRRITVDEAADDCLP